MIASVTITDSREREIGDAIRSVVDHVDRVILIDTGIKDGTVEHARRIAGDKLVLFSHDWVDFSTARNVGLKAAKMSGAEWAVIVDSDERLEFEDDFDLRAALSEVRADIIRMESADGHYPKDKIVRLSSKARFIGPTHEVLRGGARETLEGALFHELSKSRPQLKRKFARDIELLLPYIEKNPTDPRWYYYLGASYEGTGDHARAAEAFGECATRRKIGDEAAWSSYKQAEMLLILKRYDESVAAAARGMAANATFAECAWVAAVAASRQRQNDQAIAWARIAEAVGLYKGCGTNREFFRHLPASYELPYDVLRYALAGEKQRKQAEADFHAARLARLDTGGDAALERLSVLELDLVSVSRDSIAEDRVKARSMLRPPLLGSVCPSTKLAKIQFDPPNGWQPMNPSICMHNGEMLCVVRTVNYSMSGRRYTIFDVNGVVRTENYLGKLTPQGELVDSTLMRDLDPTPRKKSKIVGYEDVRLVSVDGVLMASATVCDRDPARRLIARLDLDEAGNVKLATVQPSNQLHEKNWMPVSVGGRFTYIYSLDPTCILPGPLRESPLALEHLRGGAAVPFDGGYLCVTHENIETDRGRIYLHRFVWLDAQFRVTAVSRSWVFAHYGIEFCAGIVALNGDRLVLSYGIGDREAWIAETDAQEVRELERIEP
jgi:hypothetical protein